MMQFKIEGRIAIPIRAIPFFSPGFMSPKTVMSMLVDVESFGHAPGLRAFQVDNYGATRRLHPLELHYARQEVELADGAGPLVDALRVMPAGLMVWLSEVKAMYEFLSHEYWEQESRRGYKEISRAWIDRPLPTKSQLEVALENTSHVPTANAPSAMKNRERKRDPKGIATEVQDAANAAAQDYEKLTGRYPRKKDAILTGIRARLARCGKSDATLMREFMVSWKK